jgi:hypothetical protein
LLASGVSGLPDGVGGHKGHDMDLNSRLFDGIRVKKAERAPEKAPTTPCSFPGCAAEGVFRAPKGREREGEYFSFCRDHVREYNASYDYFRGMDDASMARYRQAEARAARRRGAKGKPPQTEPPPRYNALAIKALLTLELGGDATPAKIKSRYKELVKRHHPDANGGDRSSEERLREIIQAYNFLRANKLV